VRDQGVSRRTRPTSGSNPEATSRRSKWLLRAALFFARREEMAEEATSEEEDDAGCSSQSRVHEPELGCGHFFEKPADPADEIIRPKKGQARDTDDGGGQGGRREVAPNGKHGITVVAAKKATFGFGVVRLGRCCAG
jgi:hypothetical protein